MFFVVDRKGVIWFEGDTVEELQRFVQFVMDSCSCPDVYTILYYPPNGVKRKDIWLPVYAKHCGIKKRTFEERMKEG